MRLWRGILSNLSSALLAVFLAVVVWVVAMYEKAPPRTQVFPTPIPLKILNLGPDLVITGTMPTEVRLRVRALSTSWDGLRPTSFEAIVDLQGLEAGAHEVPVVAKAADKAVAILGVDPAHFTLNLEPVAERKVRVRAKVLDEESIPLGYVSRTPVVEPDQVTIRGPQTSVSQVTEAVLEISLKSARETVTRQDAPTLLDSAGNKVQGVTVTPAAVVVKVVIERQVGYRDVTVRANPRGAPAAGYWISNIKVEPIMVTVYGRQSVIAELPGYLDTEPIELGKATQDVIKRVALALPEGVLVLGDGAGREGILVQISIQPLLGGQTVHRELKLQNLRPGLRATASPQSVDVILSGPMPALQALQPEDVQVVLDLARLGRGTHKVAPRVVLPDGSGLEFKSIVPDIVEVTIE
jgi:YbbR domain-containing protein